MQVLCIPSLDEESVSLYLPTLDELTRQSTFSSVSLCSSKSYTLNKSKADHDSYYTILYVCGTIVGVAGLVFIGLHFFPMFEPPSYVVIPCYGGGS
jgi:hypothetical protein